MNEIPEAIHIPNEDVLYIFDVDETLITKKDLAIRFYDLPEIQAMEKAYREELRDKEYYHYLRSIVLLDAETILTEEGFLEIFEKLLLHEKKAIALTLMPSGSYGKIPSLEVWRANELKGFGIDFSKTAPSKEKNIIFSELPLLRNSYPLCHEGILISHGSKKSSSLSAYLKHIDYKPEKIVFVDDLVKNLDDLDNMCQELGISFAGYHYQGVKKLGGNLDLNRVKKQFDHLTHFEKWLSDDEALKL